MSRTSCRAEPKFATPEQSVVLDGNARIARQIHNPLASGDGPIQVRLTLGKSICAVRISRIGYPGQNAPKTRAAV
jgi:hypothetical protein